MSLLVGICGGSGSGKSTLADRVAEQWRSQRGPASASVLSFDLYYHDQSQRPIEERARINYDHPDSLDGTLLASHLEELRIGHGVAAPGYDFATYSRTSEVRLVEATELIVVEGILLFAFAGIWDLLDLRVFRNCPEPVRFERRLQRDMAERARSPESVRTQFAATVKPMHDRFVQPHAERADIITEHGQRLTQMTDLVVERIVDLVTVSG